MLEYMHIPCGALLKFRLAGLWRLCMYIPFSPSPPISAGRQCIRGNMLPIRTPLPKKEKMYIHKCFILWIETEKHTKQKGKKKKRSKRQCNTRGNISACPKNPRKKNYPEGIIKVRDQGKNHTARSERLTRMVGNGDNNNNNNNWEK